MNPKSAMPLELAQRKQLQAALLSAFDNDGLRRLAGLELGSDLDLFAKEGDRRQHVYTLIAWAERAGRTVDLIRGAYVQNPTNPLIAQLAVDALRWQVCVEAGDALFVTNELAPRKVEEVYLSDLAATYAEWEQKYTPLAGLAAVESRDKPARNILSPQFMPTGFEKLVEHGYGPAKRVERVPLGDLREAVAQYKRLVVLGEPGSGKTTTLWRLVYDYACAAQKDPTAPIPLLVPLGGYTGPESVLAYAAQYAGKLAMHLPAYLAKGRLLLLLDAMNEMPRAGYEARVRRIQTVIERFPDAPLIVTCRALDYREELQLEKVDVKPLDVFRQRDYLRRYLGEVEGDKLFWQLAGGDAAAGLWVAWQQLGRTFEQLWTGKELPEDLRWSLTWPQRAAWDALHRDGLPLLALGVNPFLLVMFAEVYAATGALPQNRGRLFAAFVDTLLARERRRHPEGWPGAELLAAAYAALAFAMQLSGQRGTAVEHDWAANKLRNGGFDPEQVLYLGASATLLDSTGGQVRFVHQLIQEYFAAAAWQAHVLQGEELRPYWPQGWVTASGWEETAVLLAGLLPDMTPFVAQLLPVNPPLAARCIVESGGARSGPATIDRLQAKLVDIATSLAAPVAERSAAGNALNYLGDPRDGVGVKDGVPAIVWCAVPAGEFLMGNTKATDELAFDDEAPQHVVTLPQYAKFVAATGHEPRPHWRGKTPPRELNNHPVVYVTWHDAQAYCAWLSTMRGEVVRLPSEAEWEKAARGTDGRRYPWGADADPNRANYRDTKIGDTSAAGCFPAGESPYGCHDMAGNVWEWTSSIYMSYPYNPTDGREDPKASGNRTLRGGTWNYDVNNGVRCAYRYLSRPDYWLYDIGFRFVSPGS